MKVYELKFKVFLLKDIQYNKTYDKISYFVDSGLILDEKFLQLHNENTYKNYSFSAFYPIEKDKLYKKGKVYTITFRTIDVDLAEYVVKNMNNHTTTEIKMLLIDVREIKDKLIEKIYSITPAILKTNNGYWKNNISLEQYEERIKVNLIKKFNKFTQTKLNENFIFNNGIKFNNQKPVSLEYKDRKFLGDKVEIVISGDTEAQKLAYMALGTGILEMNARGAGYVQAKFY